METPEVVFIVVEIGQSTGKPIWLVAGLDWIAKAGR